MPDTSTSTDVTGLEAEVKRTSTDVTGLEAEVKRLRAQRQETEHEVGEHFTGV